MLLDFLTAAQTATMVGTSALLLLLLVAVPVWIYLKTRLIERRNEILASFDSEGIELYFNQYHPGKIKDRREGDESNRVLFERFYEAEFGRTHFAFPVLTLLAAVALSLIWISSSVCDWLVGKATQPGHLPEMAVASLLGAYMYTLVGLYQGWNTGALSPVDILWFGFRFGIAVPLGYSLSAIFSANMGVSLAFVLGSLPTSALMSIARRGAASILQKDSIPEAGFNELTKLTGIDVSIAETLANNGITTPLQLAYADPVKLQIKTNLGFSFLTDCASQALLYVYTPEKFQALRQATLRSSFEIRNLLLDLQSGDVLIKQSARQLFESIAVQTGYPGPILKNLICEIGDDPYAVFMHSVFYAAPETGGENEEGQDPSVASDAAHTYEI